VLANAPFIWARLAMGKELARLKVMRAVRNFMKGYLTGGRLCKIDVTIFPKNFRPRQLRRLQAWGTLGSLSRQK
jgi:hypothetical protein